VKVRQATISTHDIDFVDENREVTCPCLLGQEALFEMVNDQNGEETIAPGTRVVTNTFSPVGKKIERVHISTCKNSGKQR